MSAERPWPYSAFPVHVAAVTRPAPGLVRLTLAGDALEHLAPWGLDQRMKLVVPTPGADIADTGLLDEPTPPPAHWQARWRRLPVHARNPLRTYTPSAIRIAEREVDLDVVVHDPPGAASSWAQRARVGDPVVVTGPDARVGWTGMGIAWQPGAASRALVVGDATALPAIRNIVDAVRAGTQPVRRVEAIVELDGHDAALLPDACEVVQVRHVEPSTTPGAAHEAAVAAWVEREGPAAVADGSGFAVWLAGETASVARMRRALRAAGIDRERIAHLGYWRTGPRID